MKFMPTGSSGSRLFRKAALAAAAAFTVFSAIATTAAAAEPVATTDWFMGKAVIPAGQTSPVQIDAHDITMRADGAIGIGYRYQATGTAVGEMAGTFTYAEHGYLYFKDPTNPLTMVGSRFESGVFTLEPKDGHGQIRIADTSPETYKSGIQTLAEGNLGAHLRKDLKGLEVKGGPLTYGFFTFTDPRGTFTGYATPDFANFIIRITFDIT